MEEILHQLIWRIYLFTRFYTSQVVSRISSINSMLVSGSRVLGWWWSPMIQGYSLPSFIGWELPKELLHLAGLLVKLVWRLFLFRINCVGKGMERQKNRNSELHSSLSMQKKNPNWMFKVFKGILKSGISENFTATFDAFDVFFLKVKSHGFHSSKDLIDRIDYGFSSCLSISIPLEK